MGCQYGLHIWEWNKYLTWANWYIYTKYYHRCVSACVYSKSHCGQVLKAHTCHNTLPTEGLGRQRLLPCGVISWLPYAKLTEISFWELRPYHHSSFFHSICTPRRVFALESLPHCDWVSLSLARLSARFIRAKMLFHVVQLFAPLRFHLHTSCKFPRSRVVCTNP